VPPIRKRSTQANLGEEIAMFHVSVFFLKERMVT
jgi:hypothetical protein